MWAGGEDSRGGFFESLGGVNLERTEKIKRKGKGGWSRLLGTATVKFTIFLSGG